MPCYDNINGTLHEVSEIYNNVNGVLRPVTEGYDNVNGTLRQYYTLPKEQEIIDELTGLLPALTNYGSWNAQCIMGDYLYATWSYTRDSIPGSVSSTVFNEHFYVINLKTKSLVSSSTETGLTEPTEINGSCYISKLIPYNNELYGLIRKYIDNTSTNHYKYHLVKIELSTEKIPKSITYIDTAYYMSINGLSIGKKSLSSRGFDADYIFSYNGKLYLNNPYTGLYDGSTLNSTAWLQVSIDLSTSGKFNIDSYVYNTSYTPSDSLLIFNNTMHQYNNYCYSFYCNSETKQFDLYRLICSNNPNLGWGTSKRCSISFDILYDNLGYSKGGHYFASATSIVKNEVINAIPNVVCQNNHIFLYYKDNTDTLNYIKINLDSSTYSEVKTIENVHIDIGDPYNNYFYKLAEDSNGNTNLYRIKL